MTCKRTPNSIYSRFRQNKCIDCGKQISYGIAQRCRSCARKQTWGMWLANGKRHPAWKGGKYKCRDGYILIYQSRNHYIPEHRLIWERANGHPIPGGWIIHHLNGIKDDNRLINLVGLPKRKHYLILAAKAKRIQELEELLKNQGQFI